MINSREIQLEQGSAEWVEHRRNCYNASELAAAMGIHPHISRNELIRLIKYGTEKQYSKYVQEVIFPKGHRVEAIVREMVELKTNDHFPPTCFVADIQELARPIAASLDGASFNDLNLEIKQYSKELFESIKSGILPEHHNPQVQQGMFLNGAYACIFAVCAADEESFVHIIISRDDDFIADIPRIWKQFENDLENYIEESTAKVISESVEAFPVPYAQVFGELTVKQNLPVFGERLREYCANLPAKPDTDQDFANLEDAIKRLKLAEEALQMAEESAFAGIADVADLRRLISEYRELARNNRLNAEKLVKTEKESVKRKIIDAAISSYAAEVKKIIGDLSAPCSLKFLDVDFAQFGKGKKTLDTFREAIQTGLANAKIALEKQGEEYAGKLTFYKTAADGYEFLFKDLSILIVKQADDFNIQVESRIESHKQAEKLKIELERERIRAEEETKAKLKAEKEAKEAEREKIRFEESARAERELAVKESEIKIEYNNQPAIDAPALLKAEVEKLNVVEPKVNHVLGNQPLKIVDKKLCHGISVENILEVLIHQKGLTYEQAIDVIHFASKELRNDTSSIDPYQSIFDASKILATGESLFMHEYILNNK